MASCAYSLAEEDVVASSYDPQHQLGFDLALSTASIQTMESEPIRLLVSPLRGRQVPIAFRPSADRIEALLSLAPGWNSYSAAAVTPASAKAAITLLATCLAPCTPVPAVVPRVQGGIQLEWRANGVEIEVYVEPAGDARFYAEAEGKHDVIEAALAGNETVLSQWLARLA